MEKIINNFKFIKTSIKDVCNSQKNIDNRDDNINRLIINYYNEVKELLIANKNKLDKIAKELMNKKILFQDDIKEIITG